MPLPRLTELQKALVFVAALTVAIAGVYAWVQATQAPVVPPGTVLSPDLRIETPAWTLRYHPASTSNNTVFGLLLEASHRLNFSVIYVTYQVPQGVFVTAINGTANGQGGLYWQYWVDGQVGQVAADRDPISSGASVLWNFTTPQSGA